MATLLKSLNKSLIEFIHEQQLYFVATAASEGRINLSPKGLDTFRVIDKHTIRWLNYTGSGNETAAHLGALNRMTVMFCSFGPKPLILRLYGTAEVVHEKDSEWQGLLTAFANPLGARNIFTMDIDSVQTSCGYAVPEYEFLNQRSRLEEWSEHKGEAGISQYWKDKNVKSIDGLPTGIQNH